MAHFKKNNKELLGDDFNWSFTNMKKKHFNGCVKARKKSYDQLKAL